MAPSGENLRLAKKLAVTMSEDEIKELRRHLEEIRHHIMEEHNVRSPLLRLAPELRNRIYYFAAMNALRSDVCERKTPALLSVSRQIRHEFSGLYFSDAVMTLERVKVVDGSASRLNRIADQKTLKAVLLCVPTGNQSIGFMQIFGSKLRFIHLPLLQPTFGDFEEALGKIERVLEGNPGHNFDVAILVFDAGLRQPSRYYLT
ncbi:hypothetical protein LTR08_006387 [Meristemomyces frigidus]|nr:hypothetical protein LTR08_006387 [Meristemomyces frigidus]